MALRENLLNLWVFLNNLKYSIEIKKVAVTKYLVVEMILK